MLQNAQLGTGTYGYLNSSRDIFRLLPLCSFLDHLAGIWHGPDGRSSHHFNKMTAGDILYTEARYMTESCRLCRVLEKRLNPAAYLVGDKFTIADTANLSWILIAFLVRRGHRWVPGSRAWGDLFMARPKERKGFDSIGSIYHPR